MSNWLFLLIVVSTFCVANVEAAPGFLWATKAGGNGMDEGTAIVLDANGNSYVTGCFGSVASFGSIILTNISSSRNVFLVKYSSSGDVLWARRGGTEYANSCGRGVAVDLDGNCYITGMFTGNGVFGGITLTNNGSGSGDVFIVKYNPSGDVIWARKAGGGAGNDDSGTAIVVDGANNCFVTGRFSGIANFGTNRVISTGTWDGFIAKYDTNGNVVWVRQMGGRGNSNCGNAVAVDASNNCYIAGSFGGVANFGTTSLIARSLSDLFVTKIDTAGTFIWATQSGGMFSAEAYGVAVSDDGSSYLTGAFYGTNSFGGSMIDGGCCGSILVGKIDGAGNPLWARRAGGVSTSAGFGIALDGKQNCYVVGGFRGVATFGNMILRGTGDSDVFMASWDSAGEFLWAAQAGGTGASDSDWGFGAAADSAGNVAFAGRFYSSATFGGNTLTNTGSSDMFVAKFGTVSPNLAVSMIGANVELSWPVLADGFSLIASTNFDFSSSWKLITNSIVLKRDRNTISLPPLPEYRYFRLWRP